MMGSGWWVVFSLNHCGVTDPGRMDSDPPRGEVPFPNPPFRMRTTAYNEWRPVRFRTIVRSYPSVSIVLPGKISQLKHGNRYSLSFNVAQLSLTILEPQG
eukprot:scaffold682_cov363-Pavlova_lutheri.AAC.20